jgi:hypothetical protein
MVAGNLKPAACNIASGTLIPSTLQAAKLLRTLDVASKTDKYPIN